MKPPTPSLDELSSVMKPAIQEALHATLEAASETLSEGLYTMLSYQLGWAGEGAGPRAQGKQIRPLLVLLTAGAGGGQWQRALPVAAAVELLHNFSLIHDDIQDNSPTRRGRPTVWKRWGKAQAINAGDTMFTLANRALLDLELSSSPAMYIQANRAFQKTCLRLTQGQYLDLDFEERKGVTLDDYWQMVGGKTAALLGTATRLGAICAQVSGEREGAFYDFGYHLGLAFQAQDDILGIWGETEIVGKSNKSDLITGKKTLPIVYGLAQDGPFRRRWREGPVNMEEVPRVAQLLEQDGAWEYAQMQADRLTERSLKSLERAQPAGKAGRALYELAETLLHRAG